MLAGGGITGGQIYGKTDARGAEPAENPVTPEDLASTIYTQLGINPNHELMSPGDRPIEIVKNGSPLYNLIT